MEINFTWMTMYPMRPGRWSAGYLKIEKLEGRPDIYRFHPTFRVEGLGFVGL